MTDLREIPGDETEQTSSNLWLWIASIAIIAVPVLVGFVLLRGDDTNAAEVVEGGGSQGQGMGGDGMGGGDANSPPAGVRDFADIQATEIQIDFDLESGAAVVNVATSIDVACAVVYGPTQSLGSIATDTDMAGGAHSDHHPRLIGLSEGTVWYRLQGSAGDGTLYQGQLMQFTFPEGGGGGETVPPPLPNVADDAIVSGVSSEYSDAYAARFAIDGDLTTEWSSAGDGDDAFIELDFGENMRIKGVGFLTREMTDGTSITTSFTVTVDGRFFGPFEAGPGLAMGLFDTSGQKVRIDVETSTGGNTGAVEIEVYAEPEM